MEHNSSEIEGDPSVSNDVMKTPGIENLPDDILLQVFHLFTPQEIISQLSLVSRHWQKLGLDPSFYRKLVFTKEQPSTSMAVKLVTMAPQLVSLDIDGRDDADTILRHVGIETPRLRLLKLSCCNVTLQSLQFLQNVPKLQELRLWGLPQEFRAVIWTNIVKFCEDVEVIVTSEFSDAVLSEICKKFRASLKVVEISCCSDLDESLMEMSRCHNMTTLHLDDASCLSKNSLIAIGDMPKLVDLMVGNVHLESAEGWLRLFRKPILEKLKKLEIRFCPQFNDVVARVIMKNSKVLEKLHLNIYFSSYYISLTLNEVKQLTSHLNFNDLLLISAERIITLENGVFEEELKKPFYFN